MVFEHAMSCEDKFLQDQYPHGRLKTPQVFTARSSASVYVCFIFTSVVVNSSNSCMSVVSADHHGAHPSKQKQKLHTLMNF